MTTLVVFHSALGLRPSVGRFADRLRELGHTVQTPDLYDGAVFDDLDAGTAHRDLLGIPTLLERAMGAVAELPTDVVYGGLSMGTAPAQFLAATRPGARGALLLHGGLPLELFGLESWPPSVPVQVHVSADDPWVDADGIDAFVAAVPEHMRELVTYDGQTHLFTDEDHPDHLPEASAELFDAVTRFLAGTAAASDDRDRVWDGSGVA